MRIACESKTMSLSLLFGSDRLLTDGYAWERLTMDATKKIAVECDEALAKNSRRFGVRDVVYQSRELESLVTEYLLPMACRYLHSRAFLVRSTLFDKPADSNWAVPWHQDVTIEVEERHEVEGFGPWSVKDGLISVQPPSSILSKMLTLRLHLDPTDEENGALLVDPGSHLNGKLKIQEIVPSDPVVCSCSAGEVLMMRPLLFHASNRSVSAKPRRVLHLDFAIEPLPKPLIWR